MYNFFLKYYKYFFIILFIVFLYYIYNYVFKKTGTVLVKDKLNLNGSYNSFITNLKLPPSKIGNTFSYSFWLYLNNYAENEVWNSHFDSDKIIIHREDSSPKITYNPKYNLLKVFVNYKDEESNNMDFIIETHEVKLQKWQNVVVVLDNRKLHIYIDGKLKRVGYLPNTPFIFRKNLLLGEKNSNINGKIYNLKYFNYVLTPGVIKKEYNKNKYNVL